MAYNGVFGVYCTNTIMGRFALNHMKFHSLLTTFEDETLEISIIEEPNKRRFTLDNKNGSKVSLNFLPIQDFPFNEVKKIEFQPIEDENFIPALSIALSSTGNDSTSGVFWGVYFGKRVKGDKEISFILSADNRSRISYCEVNTPLKDVIIPRTFIEKIVAEGKPDGVAYDGRFVYFKYGDYIYFGNTLGAIYPEMSKFFDIKVDAFSINDRLKQFCKRCAILGCASVQYNDTQKSISAQTTMNDYVGESIDLNQDKFSVVTTQLMSALDFSKSMRCDQTEHPHMVIFYFNFPGIHIISQMVD